MDGSIGARTAAVMAPYADSPGSRHHAITPTKSSRRSSARGHMAGLQVGVHAIGDRAIEQVITVWERVYAALDSRERRHFRARRHRIEHFEMASAAQVERAAMLGSRGIGAADVRSLLGRAGWAVRRRVSDGSEPAPMNPFRMMIDRGIEVGAGSDTSDHAVRPGAFDRGVRDASRCGATTLEGRGDPAAHVGWRTPRASGRQEGRARSRACTRTWWRSTRIRCPSRASKGCARSSRCRSDARCSRVDRRSIRGVERHRSARASSVCHSLSAGRIDALDPRAVAFPSRHRPGGGAR